MSVQETLRRIQEEAKRKAAETLAQYQSPVVATPTLNADSLQLFRDEISSALAKAISAKAARNFVGDIVAEMHDIATAKIRLIKGDFGGNAMRNRDGMVQLYPPNCRLFIQGENGIGAVVVEDPPQLRTIFTSGRSRRETTRIALPYLVFVISFSERNGLYYPGSCGIGFRPSPLSSIEDTVYTPMLPHCDPGGNCQPMPAGAANTAVELVTAYLKVFWSSSFVYAFRPFTVGTGTKKITIKNFQEWESKIKNPLDILKADFQSNGYTVRSLMERFDNGKARTIVGNQVERHLHGIVRNITAAIDSDQLTETIHKAAQEIVNVALQNAFAESALQPK